MCERYYSCIIIQKFLFCFKTQTLSSGWLATNRPTNIKCINICPNSTTNRLSNYCGQSIEFYQIWYRSPKLPFLCRLSPQNKANLVSSKTNIDDANGCSKKDVDGGKLVNDVDATTESSQQETTNFGKQRIALDVILSNGESNPNSLISNSVPEQTTLVSLRF